MVSIVGINLALCLFFIQLGAVTSSSFKCGDDGFYANPNQCRKFIACSNGRRMDFNCPKGTSWHEDRGICDDTDMSKCATKTTPVRKARSSDVSDEILNERLMAYLKEYKPCPYHTTANPSGSTDGVTSEEGDSSGGTTRGHRSSTNKPTAPGNSEEGDSSDSTPRPSGSSTQKPTGGPGDSGEDQTTRSPNPSSENPGDNSGRSTTAGPSPSTLPPPTCPACPIPTEKTCPAAATCPSCPSQQSLTCPPTATCPPPAPQPTCPVCPTPGACPTVPPPAVCEACPNVTEKACPTVQPCPTTTTQTPKAACDAGWELFNSTASCYFFGNQTANGTDAQKSCRSLGGDLASIHSAEENAFIIQYVNSTAVVRPAAGFAFWIGTYRTGPTTADWANHDGTAVDYRNWRPSQPDNYQGQQYCNTMVNNAKYYGLWDDNTCVDVFVYVCKKPANKL